MTDGMGRSVRARALVLIHAHGGAEAVKEVAEQIYALELEQREENLVVRADVVNLVHVDDITQYIDGDECAHNIVVPVDAKDEAALQLAVDMIVETSGQFDAEVKAVVRVIEHVPEPPHVANGYIDVSELAMQMEQGISIEAAIKPGRQGESPGLNAWG